MSVPGVCQWSGREWSGLAHGEGEMTFFNSETGRLMATHRLSFHHGILLDGMHECSQQTPCRGTAATADAGGASGHPTSPRPREKLHVRPLAENAAAAAEPPAECTKPEPAFTPTTSAVPPLPATVHWPRHFEVPKATSKDYGAPQRPPGSLVERTKWADVQEVFHLPMKEAAERLGFW